MATPSGHAPSSSASAQGSGRNDKRQHEDYRPVYKKYLQLKYGFLNSHALLCDICKSLIYGSREEPQLGYEDSNLNLTETQVQDMILAHMDMFYRNVVKDLMSNYDYPEFDATTAVLATGICYGCKDPIGNALKHALTFLRCGLRVEKAERENFLEELKTLAKFVSMIVYDEQKKKHSYIYMDDFLLWLLIRKTGLSHESTLASFPLPGGLGNLKVSSSSTGLQWKEESVSNCSIIQFMPEADGTEDDKLDGSSPHSKNASEPELTPSTGIPGLPSGKFTAVTCLSLPTYYPNTGKENPMSSSDSPLDKLISPLTISESSIPEEKPAYADSKHADSSMRDFTHCRQESRRQARIIGKARRLVTLTNRILDGTRSTMPDSNCSLPKPDKTVGLESSQSYATTNFSFDVGSFSMKIVNSTSSLSQAANADAFALIPSKSSSDASLIPDYDVAGILYVLERFLSRSKDLKIIQLQYWKNWAHHKVTQATNRLNQDKAELQTLRKEKLEATKAKEAAADSTTRIIGEMDKALSWTRKRVEVASAAIRKLELEKARLEQEMEAANVRASESAANSQEASLKEIAALKKVQACERERTLFQEELVTEQRALSQLQQQLQRAQMSHDQLEARWKHAERLKLEELARALNERKQHEELEASAKSKEDMIRLKSESNMQSCTDHIKKLQCQIAELKLMIDTSNFARLDWAQTAYFTTDTSGFMESGLQRDWECVMCLAEEISVVFLPCGHQVLCTKCNELHEKQGLGDCPSCRTPIKQRICVRSAYDI